MARKRGQHRGIEGIDESELSEAKGESGKAMGRSGNGSGASYG